MLPFRARVDLGTMTMKGYTEFPKVLASLEPNHQIVWCNIQDTHLRVLPFWRDAVGVFYSASQQGKS